MKKENRRRLILSSSYIGAGNITSVFNRKPKIPYKKLKEIYGDELEKFKSKRVSKSIPKRKLTNAEIKEIRNKVRTNVLQERKKNLIVGLIAIVILIVIVYLIIDMFNDYFYYH
ncbi:MAG: hypothetical protein ABFS35_22435 [Bacteroidota bacterium]